MGLPTRDSAPAYHPGLPKVPPPLLRVGREYAAVKKHQGSPHVTEQGTIRDSPIHQTQPTQPLKTSLSTLTTTATDDEDSNSQLSPLPLTIDTDSGSSRTSPYGGSPRGHLTPSPPILFPVSMPLFRPELVPMTTAASVTIFPPVQNMASVAKSDASAKSTASSDSNILKQTRKQNMLTFEDEEKQFPAHSQERLLMRPWLMERLEFGDIPGMMWVEKANHLFQIPWKHGSRREWEHDTDAKLFRMWAQHTGKYRPGHPGSVTDPKTWKANFRCAINSLPDVVEVKEMNVTSKKGPNAFKVYTFLAAKSRKRGSKVESKKIMQLKREQEVQQILSERARKQPQKPNLKSIIAEPLKQNESVSNILAKPSLSPPEPQPNPQAQAPQAPSAAQANTIFAKAIELVIRNDNEMENKSYHQEKPKENGKTASGESPHRTYSTENCDQEETRTTPMVNYLTKANTTSSTTYTPTSSQITRVTCNESHIPHKKRKIMDINFPASTSVNVSQTSKLNSLVEILSSDERPVKRIKEEQVNSEEVVDMSQSKTQNTKEHCGVDNVNVSSRTQGKAQKIPPVVCELSKTDKDYVHETQERYYLPQQREMKVNLFVQAIPRCVNEDTTMTNHYQQHHQQVQNTVGGYPRMGDNFGSRVHKNKEFLKRFLKDNGVRTLIKTKLDEIHRSPAYHSVLQGQPCIPTSIEGPLGQSNNTTCSVV